jgi:hypothetical protein
MATETADETDSDRDALAVAHVAWGDLIDV